MNTFGQWADIASMLAIRLAEDVLAFKLTYGHVTVIQSVAFIDTEIKQINNYSWSLNKPNILKL